MSKGMPALEDMLGNFAVLLALKMESPSNEA